MILTTADGTTGRSGAQVLHAPATARRDLQPACSHTSGLSGMDMIMQFKIKQGLMRQGQVSLTGCQLQCTSHKHGDAQ